MTLKNLCSLRRERKLTIRVTGQPVKLHDPSPEPPPMILAAGAPKRAPAPGGRDCSATMPASLPDVNSPRAHADTVMSHVPAGPAPA
jgi:hypothetical protein